MKKAKSTKKETPSSKKGKLKTALSLVGLFFGVIVTAYMVIFTQNFLHAVDDVLNKDVRKGRENRHGQTNDPAGVGKASEARS